MNLRKAIIASLFAMVIMIVLYLLTTLGFMGNTPVGQTTGYNNPLIVPQPYAFSIWGILYIGIIAFPIYAWFNRQFGDPQWKVVHTWYAVNVVLNGLWLVAASFQWLIISLVIIAIMLYSLFRIRQSLVKIEGVEPVSFWGEKLVFTMYFAWITLATALNVAAALAFYNWSGFGISELNWSIIMLPVLAGVAYFVYSKYKDIGYAGVVIWAFVALVVKHLEVNPILGYISIAVVVLYLGLILGNLRRKIA